MVFQHIFNKKQTVKIEFYDSCFCYKKKCIFILNKGLFFVKNLENSYCLFVTQLPVHIFSNKNSPYKMIK
jgi:hypothetical protein